jgi:uncharacterized protein
MKKDLRMHRRNPLFTLLKLYLKVRGEESHNNPGLKKTALRMVRMVLGRACSVYPLFLGINPRFQWFSDRAAGEAEQIRKNLLEKLSSMVNSTAGGSKLYTGTLSRGCLHCIEGDWACNFINRLCNRDCFFCKRSHRSISEEPESETWGFFFPSPSAHISYLKTFHTRGISFSGGEPLLVRERLLEHIKAVRQEFSDSVYIWMYTNGDLADRAILEELRAAGLDEIRFNIAAREYDLSPVIMAKEYIPVVTVEIPCIPEDHELLKTLLPVMEKAGVNFLNIHQLSVEEQNCRDLIQRKYHFTGFFPGIFVHESEISALKLLLHACDTGINLPINYCTSIYKNRYQGRGFRKQRASAFPLGFEELTDTGYLRRVTVSSSPGPIRELALKLETEIQDNSQWNFNKEKSRIILHSSLVSYIDWTCSRTRITYLKPGVSPGPGSGRLEADNLKENKKIAVETGDLDQALFDLWYRLYIKKEDPESALGIFSASSTEKAASSKYPGAVLNLKEYELQQQGLPKII